MQTEPKPESAYARKVARNLEGIDAVSTGACPGCRECMTAAGFKSLRKFREARQNGKTVDEPSFSWSQCGICDSNLGGDRSSWHGIIDGKIRHWEDACVDCVMYLANGDEPESEPEANDNA